MQYFPKNRFFIRTSLTALAVLTLAGCNMNVEDTPPEEVKSEDIAVKIPEARPDSVTDRFARLALQCVHREYPNKIGHVLNNEKDAKVPKELTPAFYGCFDWHSSVHGHWLLARILKTDPQSPMNTAIITALNESFTEDNINKEIAYYKGENRASFERPYGIAWFLQLTAELHESDDPQLEKWRKTLRPLENAIVLHIKDWLPKLVYPVRSGTHNQTAFAFGLMLDYARTVNDEGLEKMLVDHIRKFYGNDKNCPIGYEPSGEDFLSPCLMEADLMRRVMEKQEFAVWLASFLPAIPTDGSNNWLAVGEVRDATDGKLVHLDGLNLSRAWAMDGIALSLPVDDPRRDALLASSAIHRTAGLAAVSDKNYEGSHWLGSFATYLMTHRGTPDYADLVSAEQAEENSAGEAETGDDEKAKTEKTESKKASTKKTAE